MQSLTRLIAKSSLVCAKQPRNFTERELALDARPLAEPIVGRGRRDPTSHPQIYPKFPR